MKDVGIGGFLTIDEKQATTALASAQKALAKLDEALTTTGKKTETFGGKLSKIANNVKTGFGKIQSGFQKIGAAGRTATLAVAPFGAAFGYAIKKAMDFEEGMARLATVMPDEVMATAGDKVMDFAVRFGTSTGEVQQAALMLKRSGVDAADVFTVLDDVMKTSKGTFTDVGATIDVFDRIVDSFGLSANDSTQIFNSMVAAVNKGEILFSDVSRIMGRTAFTAKTLGLSYQDLLVTISAASKQGMNQRVVMSGLSSVLNGLISPTEKQQAAAAAAGVSFNRMEIASKGLVPFLLEVAEKSKKTGVSLHQLLGNTSAFNLAVALGSKEGKKAYAEASKAIIDSNGAMDKSFGKVAETASFKFKQMGTAISDIGVIIGTEFLDSFAKTFEDITKSLTNFRGAFTELKNINFNDVAASQEQVNALSAKYGETTVQAAMGIRESIQWVKDAFNSLKQTIGEYFGTVSDPSGVRNFIKMATKVVALTIALGPLLMVLGMVGSAIGSVISAISGLWSIGSAAFGGLTALAGALGIGLAPLIGIFVALVGWTVGLLDAFDKMASGIVDIANGKILKGIAKMMLSMVDIILTPIRWITKGIVWLAESVGIEVADGLKRYSEEGFYGLAFETPKKEEARNKMIGTFNLGRPAVMPEVLGEANQSIMPDYQLAPFEFGGEQSVAVVDEDTKREMATKGVAGTISSIPTGGVDTGAEIAKLNEQLKGIKAGDVNVNLDTRVDLDGKKIGSSVARHNKDLMERSGFKATNWQRRNAVEFGAISFPQTAKGAV